MHLDFLYAFSLSRSAFFSHWVFCKALRWPEDDFFEHIFRW